MSYRNTDVTRLVDLQCKKWELQQFSLTGQFGGAAAKSELEAEQAAAAKKQPAAKGSSPQN